MFKCMLLGLLLTWLTIHSVFWSANLPTPSGSSSEKEYYRPLTGSLPTFYKRFHSKVFKYRKTDAYEEPFATDYYLEFQRAMRKFTLEASGNSILNPHVVIVSQLYGKDRNAPHYHDMLTSIQMNLLNPFVSEYHFLQEDDTNNNDIMKLIGAAKKVNISVIGQRMTSGFFMNYCNLNLRDKIVILTNTDIYFDQTIVHTSKMEHDTSIMLSRRQTFITNYLEGENRDHCVGGYVGSHDAFIFRTTLPFPQKAIEKLNTVPLGYYGSENVIMFHSKNNRELNYKIRNSCKSIFVWHLHEMRGTVNGPPPRINGFFTTATARPNE